MNAHYVANDDYYVIRKSHPPAINVDNLVGWETDIASDGSVIFYDSFTKIKFKSSLENLYLARYHLNRNFALGQYQTLADFYEFMGVYMTKPEYDMYAHLGWGEYFFSSGYVWIDIDISQVDMMDNIYTIIYGYEPEDLEEV